MELVRAGKQAEAREALKRIIVNDGNHAMAWAAMVQLADSDQERQFCLKQVLRLKPGDPWATQRLHSLQAAPSQPPRTAPAIELPHSVSQAPAQLDERPAPARPSPAEPTPAAAPPPKPDESSSVPAPRARASSARPAGGGLTIQHVLLFGGALLAIALVLIFMLYQEYFAVYPGDKDKVIALAREWVKAESVGDYVALKGMACAEYARQIKPDTYGFMAVLQARFASSGVKYTPATRNLTYEVIGIGGKSARVRVSGFMQGIPRAETGIDMVDSVYDLLDRQVFLMKREDGRWKWCGSR